MRDEASADDLSVRLSGEAREGVLRLATAIGRSPDWVVEQAAKAYIAREGADFIAAARGDAEFAAGESDDFDDILADIEAIVHGKAA